MDAALADYGTPPRRRGGPRRTPAENLQLRNTPASAGRTAGRTGSPGRRPEHPRVGGGGREELDPLLPQRRNTPASAGRTPRGQRSAVRRPEHPRVGGEDLEKITMKPVVPGTPPRRRGGHGALAAGRAAARNTPASARRTGRAVQRAAGPPEHPRVGGEDDGGLRTSRIDAGTPPRRRGGPRPRPGVHGRRRNTPASAGRTRSRPMRWLNHCGTPPRRRGGRVGRHQGRGERRNTPASAGKTPGHGRR